MDFKRPVEGKNKYVLFVVDEFSRYPFAFPCSNISSTVIQCLSQLFCLFVFLPVYTVIEAQRLFQKTSNNIRTAEESPQLLARPTTLLVMRNVRA